MVCWRTRWLDKGAQTRERILAAAEPLVLRQGYAGTSLDDILGASGLTKGAFFHHFKDKSAFARALIERCACNDTDRFERCAVAGRGRERRSARPGARLPQGDGGFHRKRPTPIAGCVLAAYTYEIMQFEPELQAYIGAMFPALVGGLREEIRGGAGALQAGRAGDARATWPSR